MRRDGGGRSPVVAFASMVALAAYAVVALGSGLDRLGERNPVVADRVPATFAALSHLSQAAINLRAGRFAEAEPLAREAVTRAPLEPSSAGLLGAALLGQERLAAADKAFRVAGQLGWRDLPTQVYWLRVSALTGDWDIAAQRADAVMRADPSQTRNPQVTGVFEADPAGRAALIERMRERPAWIDTYFRPSDDSPPDVVAARADILRQLGTRAAVSCRTAAPLAGRLARAGNVARGFAVYSANCARGDAGLLRDPDLSDAVARPETPFEWSLVSSGALSVRKVNTGLAVTNRAAFPRTLVRQLTVLPAGQYRLSWREEGAGAGPRVVPISGCAPERGDRPTPQALGENRFTVYLSPNTSCEGQWITLMVANGAGETTVGDVRLVRAAGT